MQKSLFQTLKVGLSGLLLACSLTAHAHELDALKAAASNSCSADDVVQVTLEGDQIRMNIPYLEVRTDDGTIAYSATLFAPVDGDLSFSLDLASLRELPVRATPTQTRTYTIAVSNITNAQPMSPVAVILHESDSVWQFGMPSSNALEVLAEGGDNSNLLAESFVVNSASGAAPIGPGSAETITVTTQSSTANLLSIVTMLVNTNDAFTGLTAMDVSGMAVGDSVTRRLPAYDAGTEMNTEAAGTIPGPADGGEGYNAERNDVINAVARHAGVVSRDDGLSSSVLTEQHRFDNPVLAVTITRTE